MSAQAEADCLTARHGKPSLSRASVPLSRSLLRLPVPRALSSQAGRPTGRNRDIRVTVMPLATVTRAPAPARPADDSGPAARGYWVHWLALPPSHGVSGSPSYCLSCRASPGPQRPVPSLSYSPSLSLPPRSRRVPRDSFRVTKFYPGPGPVTRLSLPSASPSLSEALRPSSLQVN